MDRNVFLTLTVRNVPVALRKESVDRNVNLRVLDGSKSSSLSARRAWIEIEWIKAQYPGCRSLSARRAWIEISPAGCWRESRRGRSPQGERG